MIFFSGHFETWMGIAGDRVDETCYGQQIRRNHLLQGNVGDYIHDGYFP